MAKMTCACEENCWTKHAIELGWPYMGWEAWKEFEVSLSQKPEHGSYVIDVETSRVFVDPEIAKEYYPTVAFVWPPPKRIEDVVKSQEHFKHAAIKGPFTDPKDNAHSIPRMPKGDAMTANEYFQSGQIYRDNEEMRKQAAGSIKENFMYAIKDAQITQKIYNSLQTNFSSGAKSSDAGTKGIAQISIRALCRIGGIFMEGIESGYERDNWKKGIFDEAFKEDRGEHAVRHLMLYLNGNRDEDHLAKVGWAMIVLMELEEQEKVEEENGRNAQKMQGERAQEEAEPFL